MLVLQSAAVHAEDYSYEALNNQATITGYNGPVEAVRIRDTIAGPCVTRLAQQVFASRHSLASVAIPYSITITGSPPAAVPVEASTGLATGGRTDPATATLADPDLDGTGIFHFRDPGASQSPARFYRLGMP